MSELASGVHENPVEAHYSPIDEEFFRELYRLLQTRIEHQVYSGLGHIE